MEGLRPCHIKSASQKLGFLEIDVETEHLKYQALGIGTAFLVVDCHAGRMVTSDDPMLSALHKFLDHNVDKVKEVMS